MTPARLGGLRPGIRADREPPREGEHEDEERDDERERPGGDRHAVTVRSTTAPAGIDAVAVALPRVPLVWR